MQPDIRPADLADPAQAATMTALLDGYARDPMGGGTPLAAEVRARLPAAMAAVPGALTLLAWADGQAVGLANCFPGFSTFAAAPLLNIHDLYVAPHARGQGVAAALLAAVADAARARGCCKVTLEVLAANTPAQASYRRAGFAPYGLDPAPGPALGPAQFWQRTL